MFTEYQLISFILSYKCNHFGVTALLKLTEQFVIYRGRSTILGILQRNLSRCSRQVKEHAYSCLVRPQLECSTSTWSPYTQKDIKTIESVKRRAARFTLNNDGRTSSGKEIIADLSWDSFENRRKCNDLVQFFSKNINNLMDIPFPKDMV